MAHITYRDLKDWRLRKGLTQKEAAKFFEISTAGWHKLEHGQATARPNLLRKLLAVTGVSLEVLTRTGIESR